LLGIADEEFIRGKVPMTKREIRIITLANLAIEPTDVIYDIGAGTGSMSIEAALLADKGQVFALERNNEAIDLIKGNREKFNAANLKIIEAYAPDGLADLPLADKIIVGGSGGKLAEILEISMAKLKKDGRIVINAIALQTAMGAIAFFRGHNINYEAVQLQVNRLKKVGRYDMAEGLNPIYIITARKDAE